MLSLYEILKASKTGIAPDMWTALAGKNWGGADSGAEVKELTGILPLGFKADGTPLLDYLISGNMSQTGTPTHTTPITPSECGERTGNLYNINAKDVNNGYVNNVQLNQDGTTTTWGSAEISEYIPISGDTAYTFNGIGSYNSPCYGLYDENKQLIGAYRYNGAQIIKFTSPNNARYFRFTHIKTATRAMMVEGAYTTSTMPNYEPYGYKIPISSANTTTPVYLGEVETTRKIRELVFDGTENWVHRIGDPPNVFFLEISNINFINNLAISTHYINQDSGSFSDLQDGHFLVRIASSRDKTYICLRDSNFPATPQGRDQLKEWLTQQYAAGTPVTVWYVLATETTGIVNEPLRKIGDYADTISMEQTGVQIPTVKGNTVIDVETELKPSEMYIKYQE